jgi:hypothetical protein
MPFKLLQCIFDSAVFSAYNCEKPVLLSVFPYFVNRNLKQLVLCRDFLFRVLKPSYALDKLAVILAIVIVAYNKFGRCEQALYTVIESVSWASSSNRMQTSATTMRDCDSLISSITANS